MNKTNLKITENICVYGLELAFGTVCNFKYKNKIANSRNLFEIALTSKCIAEKVANVHITSM